MSDLPHSFSPFAFVGAKFPQNTKLPLTVPAYASSWFQTSRLNNFIFLQYDLYLEY